MHLRFGVLLLLLSVTLSAQSTQDELKQRLARQPLYLAGQWGEDHLKFDSTGKLNGKARPITFTLSGIDVKSINLKKDKLVLSGQRVGITFKDDAWPM